LSPEGEQVEEVTEREKGTCSMERLEGRRAEGRCRRGADETCREGREVDGDAGEERFTRVSRSFS
jgi:hypothetical protein